MLRVGLISDTHDLLRPEAKDFLRGSDYIVHAGDICCAEILEELATLAPVTAVRGNNDRGTWADGLAETERLRVGGIEIHVIHDTARLAHLPAIAPARVLVCGHSHKPRAVWRNEILYVNPGSAGRRRFKLPIAAGELVVSGARVSARIVELTTGAVLASCEQPAHAE